MSHFSYVTCHILLVMCHLTLMPTATVTDPPPAISITMHSRPLDAQKKEEEKKKKKIMVKLFQERKKAL